MRELLGARAVANWANLSTPLGMAVARLSGADLRRGARGTYVATGYRLGVPVASAFTLGNVITTRYPPGFLEARPALLAHEERHCTQYALTLGPVMLPLCGVAAAVSWAVAGDGSSYNPFERLAGLADGAYVARPPRWRR